MLFCMNWMFLCVLSLKGMMKNVLITISAVRGFPTTLFVIAEGPDEYEVMIDGLASYSDYKFFPYLADCLCQHLNHESLAIPESAGRTAYRVYDESWIEDSIGEEVAMLKSALSVFPPLLCGISVGGCRIYFLRLAGTIWG
mgnify:CR=1 FL=1